MSTLLRTSFSEGLRNIPGRLSAAKGDHHGDDLKSHQHHGGGCGERVHYAKRGGTTARVCDAGHPVEWADIVSGYNIDGRTIIPSNDDWANIETASHELELVEFVDASKIRRIVCAGKSYWWDPENKQTVIDAYQGLRQAMVMRGVGAVVKFMIRTKPQLGLLEPDDDGGMTVHTLSWPDEIRERTYVAGGPAKPKIVGDALDWIDGSMGQYGVGDGYVDQGAVQLRELLLALAADPVAAVEAADTTTEAVDLDDKLMADLKASIVKPKRKRATKKA